MKKVYVNCGGKLNSYNSKKEVMDFFEDCILMSEGSERDRYTTIYFSVKDNLNNNFRFFSDGTKYVYDSDIDPDVLNDNELHLLEKYYGLTKENLLKFKVNHILEQNAKRITDYDLSKYNDIDEMYKKSLSKQEETSFYYLDDNTITCIDTSAKGVDKYWIEDFLLKDYEYADKWLKGEIEYSAYLNDMNIKKEDYNI